VSFDLFVFEPDAFPSDPDAMMALLEDEERFGRPLTPRLAAFAADLTAAHPGLDDDPDASPWASWPLDDSIGDGTALFVNIRWSEAERMRVEVERLCSRHGLLLFDPQTDEVVRPGAP
jgi:hypothetical protein